MVGPNWRGLQMLQVQRPFGYDGVWQMPAPLPRALSSLPERHRVAAALVAIAIVGMTAARLVDAPYVPLGLLLHFALALSGVTILSAMASRSRRARAAEAAGVAHDLRGPLVSLQVTLELLANDGFGTLPEQARTAVLGAAAAAARAADVVEHTLERATSRATPYAASPVDLDHVLREALAALAVQVRTSGATVEAGPLPRVSGDPSALFRVFVNLLQNGLKYHRPDALPRIAVTARARDGWAEIAVTDHGIGIALAERSRVFQRQYRTDAGTARAAGAGLGLATVRRLITEMGGAVWVDCTTPRGTTIMVRLPLA